MKLTKQELETVLWLFAVAEGETQLDPPAEELRDKIVEFLKEEVDSK